MKVAVIGAGIFGCTAAIKLAESGHKVFLFEKNKTILSNASTANQYRLHRGYHYPRSTETVKYVKESCILFEEEFSSSICRTGYNRYYAISNEKSLTSSTQYLDFLCENDLTHKVISELDVLKGDKVGLIVQVFENGFDINELYLLVSAKLSSSKVNLRTNTVFRKEDMEGYDVVINATYSNLNELLSEEHQVDYQYEICEKPIVKLPNQFQGKSVVVLDGDFCCVDPFGFVKEYQVLGHVKEAIHFTNIGKKCEIPYPYERILNNGRVFTNMSRFDNIWEGFTKYFNVNDVEYKGSMFTIRTVLPQHEHDDARPSNVIKHSDSLYSIFSGKIGTCVDIANKLIKMI